MDLKTYILESMHPFKTLKDVEEFLDKFRDDETSWRGATDELMDIARLTREYLEEYDNIKVEAINFKRLKTPSEWNTTWKKYISGNLKQMSASTQDLLLKHLNK